MNASLDEQILEFIAAEVRPRAEALDELDRVDRSLLAALARFGFLRLFAPDETTGLDVNLTGICRAREEFSKVSSHADSLFAMQGIGSYPIRIAGSDKQKASYLEGVMTGRLVPGFALTEPSAGSDVGSIQTTAERHGPEYVINGDKSFISNANDADFFVVVAHTGPEAGTRGLTALIVDGTTPGLRRDDPIPLLAPHAVGNIHFEGCVVPESSRLGNDGDGFRIAMRGLDIFRTSVGAAAVGIGHAALGLAIERSTTRIQFGAPISRLQAIQFKLADMATSLRAARLLVYDAASKHDANSAATITREASMAKLFATEAAGRIVDEAVQIHGAVGLVRGTQVERLYRQARAMRIYEGASEIHRIIIARSLIQGGI